MNSKHLFVGLSVFTLVSIAHGEREVFAPSKLAPTAQAGTILFDDGTQAAPSMSFKNDTDTGILRSATNTLSFATNGTFKAHISSSTTPTLVIGNQAGTSGSPLDGILGATSGGGVDIAGANLSLRGGNSTGTAAGGYLAFQTAPAGGVSGSSANTLTERMRITSTGRVGIGTTNPAAKLHVVEPTLVQQFRVQDVETDATQKVGVMGVGHYTNSQAPMSVIFGRSQATTNDVSIGGNSSSFNAATQITLHTAANNTTTTGTERIRVKSGGQMRFVPLAADPTVSVEDGDVYYNSTTNKLRVRAAGVWVDLH